MKKSKPSKLNVLKADEPMTDEERAHAHKWKRTAIQRAEDLAFAAGLRLRRLPLTEIMRQMNARPNRRPVSLGTVHGDCKLAEKIWREEAVAAVQIGKDEMLAELDLIRQEAWRMWEASKKPRVVKSAKKRGVNADQKGGNNTESGVVQEERHGDVAALKLLIETQERKAKLLGLDAPIKQENINDSPPKLTVIVNAPKDDRPWHEKVYDATGVRIKPQAPAELNG